MHYYTLLPYRLHHVLLLLTFWVGSHHVPARTFLSIHTLPPSTFLLLPFTPKFLPVLHTFTTVSTWVILVHILTLYSHFSCTTEFKYCTHIPFLPAGSMLHHTTLHYIHFPFYWILFIASCHGLLFSFYYDFWIHSLPPPYSYNIV